ncbi:MAG: hypothetical protein JRH15_18090, partial [Deltaproteobacteria bacterium]|nr:hypothetical protein [Deltaproteobacteria bacterium]
MDNRFIDQLLDEADGPLENGQRKRPGGDAPVDDASIRRFKELKAIIALTRKVPKLEVPSDFTAGVMTGVRMINPPWWVRSWRFLVRTRQIRFSVLGAISGATVMAVAASVLLFALVQRESLQIAASPEVEKEYLIRFTYHNPE